MAQSEHNNLSSSGSSAAAVSPIPAATPRNNHATTPAVDSPRCHPPIPAKCPCEERTSGILCRQESDSMTTLGKLLCKVHREELEAKFHIVINRLAIMLP